MYFVAPVLEDIPGDNKDHIMGRSCALVGCTKSRAVIRYGFLQGSDNALAHKVFSQSFTWLLIDEHSRVLDRYEGFAWNLPKRYRAIIEKDYLAQVS